MQGMSLPTSAELFLTAARKIVEHSGPHGSQKDLAETMGVRPPYLSDLLAGRRAWTDALRDKFSTATGYTVAEIYLIGEELARTGAFFPFMREVEHSPPHSIQRACLICQHTLKRLSIHLEWIANPHVLKVWNPTKITQYLKGAMSDGRLYEELDTHFRKALKSYHPSK